MKKLLSLLAAVTALTVAPASSAKAQLITCALGSSLCISYHVMDYTSGSLSLRVWNASPASQQGRVESVALWNVGGISGQLFDWNASSDVAVTNPGKDWSNGTPSGWVGGPVAAPSLAAKTGMNSGITGDGGSAGGGAAARQTQNTNVKSLTEYLAFRSPTPRHPNCSRRTCSSESAPSRSPRSWITPRHTSATPQARTADWSNAPARTAAATQQ